MIQYIKHIRIESEVGILFTANNYKSYFVLVDFFFIHDTIFDRDSSTFLTLSIELDNILQKSKEIP